MRLSSRTFLLALASQASAQLEVGSAAGEVDCLSFWIPFSYDGGFGEIVEQLRAQKCRVMPGYPRVVGDRWVTVVTTREWEQLYNDTSSLRGEGFGPVLNSMLAEAFTRSLSLYQTLGDVTNLPPTVLILTNKDGPAGLTTVAPAGGPCMITALTSWNDWAMALNPWMQQSLAHELYHCVQFATNPDLAANTWVSEGTAEYFSNLVFPSADHEWVREVAASRGYRPDLPLYAQDRIDTAGLFFQALEASRGPPYLHHLMTQTPAGELATPAERARLSRTPGFAGDFFLFATQYVTPQTFPPARQASYPTLIRDTNGLFRPVANMPLPVPVPLALGPGPAGAQSGRVTLTTVPFTLTQFAVALDGGQTVRLSSNARGAQRLAYRQGWETHWRELPGGAAAAESTIVVPCKDGTPVEIVFLFVSTEDKSSDTVEVSFSQDSEEEGCECKETVVSGRKLRRRGGLQGCEKPKPEERPAAGNGSCVAVPGLAMDSCIPGPRWTVDLSATKRKLQEVLATMPEVTLTGVSGGFSALVQGQNATFSFDDLRVDTAAAGTTVSVLVQGRFDAGMFITSGGNGAGTLCLDVYAGEGKASTRNPLGGDLTIDLTGPSGFVPYGMVVQYTCAGNGFNMQGTGPDGVAWGPWVFTR